MEQSMQFQQTFNSLLSGNNSVYTFLTVLMLTFIAITFVVAIFKIYFLMYEHHYSTKFIKDFKRSGNFESLYVEAEIYENKSIAAKAFLHGFKSFYGIFKINQNYQSGSAIELAKKTMNLTIDKSLADTKNYFWILYLTFLMPCLAIGCIIINYANHIELNNGFEGIEPSVLIDSLRLLFVAIMSSVVIFSIFLFIDKYLEYRIYNLETFVDEFAYIIHKNFYAKESDSEKLRSI